MNDHRKLTFDLPPQPTPTSCGPTCLHGIYRYFDDELPLETLIREIPELESGGTLGVCLGQHALRRGYQATFYSFNLLVFDPTWFSLERKEVLAKLDARRQVVTEPKLQLAIEAYSEFIRLGGELRFTDLNSNLLRKYLRRELPILTGLSATFLYRSRRENPQTCADDDIGGEPTGHFVVISGYDHITQEAHIVDPYQENPLSEGRHYSVKFDRLINSILLGSYTYDANLLIIQPRP